MKDTPSSSQNTERYNATWWTSEDLLTWYEDNGLYKEARCWNEEHLQYLLKKFNLKLKTTK